MSTAIARVEIRDELDVVHARKRARLVAEILGFDRNDQTRLSTAVSEIARNAYQYAGGGDVEFRVQGMAPSQIFAITVRDRGPGIEDLQAILEGRYVSATGMGLGILGTRRLLDRCDVETKPGKGTTVSLGKTLPRAALEVTPAVLRRIADALATARSESPLEEMRAHNQELLAALDQLRQRDEELSRVNQELAETNSGMIAVYSDLEQKHRDLEAVNQELEAFSYSVSHDLRGPLRSIDGFSQALLEDYADRLDDGGKKYLSRVRESAQGMGELIDGLLALAQVTRSELRREVVDMSRLARDIGVRLQKRDSGSARRVEFQVEEGLCAEGDARLLANVLDNLLGNAWKFTSKRSEARIEVGRSLQGDVPAFFVRDNGAGFDMTYANKLFGAFQRLHAATEFEGHGIGLATVQRIVRRHGGRIWPEAQVGVGATFYFTLGEGEPT
jgi:signal transduction histidine kinase